ncbi:MAG: hypothetical protein NWP80_01230 [Candidatus Gracilibacteria bacterium]|nr:hypothetical protein [Candidatus Gracilibacteria bacterium]
MVLTKNKNTYQETLESMNVNELMLELKSLENSRGFISSKEIREKIKLINLIIEQKNIIIETRISKKGSFIVDLIREKVSRI